MSKMDKKMVRNPPTSFKHKVFPEINEIILFTE